MHTDSVSAFLGEGIMRFLTSGWQLAAMNIAVRRIDFNFGKQPAKSFTNDLHPDLRADYMMANPPFNMKEWWDGKLEGDPRYEHGDPPKGNANFGWRQHMQYHLAPKGSMALLLANGSMSSNTDGEGEIRETIVKADLVECMVALPGQLFTNTQIPACIWFLTKTKQKRGRGVAAFRDRTGEVLLIDARKLGYMVDRVLRAFTDEDTAKIVSTFHAWKRTSSPRPLGGEGQGEGEVGYEDIPGFHKNAKSDEIAERGFVLTPGRYVGAEDVEDDGVPFVEKMESLTRELAGQFHESKKLRMAIRDASSFSQRSHLMVAI
jgi:type I restriction enzyme M protein